MTDKESPSLWKSLKDNFPWKDMFSGFLIPKVLFLYGAHRGMPFFWGAVAIIWCVAVFYLNQVKTHKVNFFAIFSRMAQRATVLLLLNLMQICVLRNRVKSDMD